MAQLFNIQDDKVVINKLALKYLEGSVTHVGQLHLTGTLNLQGDMSTNGTITAETIKVKNLITETGSPVEAGRWAFNTEEELVGKGLNWAWGNGSVNLMYRDGRRIYANADFDLETGQSYKIGNTVVLSQHELSPQVTKSRLREVGDLKSLTVLGNSVLGEFAFFSAGQSRLGLNTDEPNGTLSVVENDVEIIVGSPAYGRAAVGTYTNHSLSLITDNTDRIVIKNSGEVVFGDEITKNANVKINGTLTVENIISDTRVDRYASLEFKSTRDSTIFGKGLVWTGTGAPRQLMMMENPDRLWTSESFDLGSEQSYYINGTAVLSSTGLGSNVTHSSLTKLGILENLTVQGNVKFQGDLDLSAGTARVNVILLQDQFNNSLTIDSNRINTSSKLSVNVAEDEVIYADHHEIAIGNKQNTRRPVKMYGPVSVGVNNPDPTVDLTVKGNVSFANKKFITGTAAPITGEFNNGDICWNTSPQSGNYVGWVCVVEGAPGEWLPFGAIASQ